LRYDCLTLYARKQGSPISAHEVGSHASPMTIPRTIHYCWFGGSAHRSRLIERCIASWRTLDDFTLVQWNEETFDPNCHAFTRLMYEQRRYAFVSDFVRLKALYERGGIYLDTDVEVRKRFDDAVLAHRMFIPFQYDCALSTAVIGAEPGHPVIGRLLDLYDNLECDGPNNSVFTSYFLESFPEFRLDNRFQRLDDGVAVYPKEYFDCPTGDPSMGFSVHHAVGSWNELASRTGAVRGLAKGLMWAGRKVLTGAMGEAAYAQWTRRLLARRTEFWTTHLQHRR
jgi:hypothetical protein